MGEIVANCPAAVCVTLRTGEQSTSIHRTA
jgi:hypothetical protein